MRMGAAEYFGIKGDKEKIKLANFNALFQSHSLLVRCKLDTYQKPDQPVRIRFVISRAFNCDYKAESKHLLDALK